MEKLTMEKCDNCENATFMLQLTSTLKDGFMRVVNVQLICVKCGNCDVGYEVKESL